MPSANDAFINNSSKAQIFARWAVANALTMGAGTGEDGAVIIDGSAGASGGALSVGPCSGCDGTSIEGSIYIGREGNGAMDITNGGLVYSTGFAYIAPLAGSSGTVTVDGAGSAWNLTDEGKLLIGAPSFGSDGGTALLNVINGANIIITNSFAGANSVTVGTSGTLTGNGTLTVNGDGPNASRRVSVSGTLAPRGTFTINGTLAVNSLSSTECGVTPEAADRVNVSGIVNLGGRLSVTMEGTFTPAVTRYTLLYAGGGRHVNFPTFNSVSIKYPNQFFTPHITYDGDYVYLDLDFTE